MAERARTMSRRACCAGLVGSFLAACGPRGRPSASTPAPPVEQALGRGLALRGRVWLGGAAAAFDDGLVLVDADGSVVTAGPASGLRVPEGVRRLGSARSWVGPGLVDAHVHLAFGAPFAELRGGLVAVRDLGAPPAAATGWQTPRGVAAASSAASPAVAVAGPLLTAPAGYPSTTWGADGFAAFLGSPARARGLVRELASSGVDLIKIALEPAGGLPVPPTDQVRAVVQAAHDVGLRVTAHALSVEMVGRALDGGVDELAHVPQEELPAPLVDRIAAAGVPVVSTLQTFFAGGDGRAGAHNAAALHRAGVALCYGTDLGNAGTRPGVDPRELERLAQAGLGRLGALRAASEGSALAAGLRAGRGRITAGEPAALVLLSADPVEDPTVWRRPLAVVADDRLVLP